MATTKTKILIVDDSPTAIVWMTNILSSNNYEVQSSKTMWIASLMTKFQPEIAIIDVNISRSRNNDGPMIIKTFKDKSFAVGTRFILYSSVDEDTLSDLAEKCGAHGYLKKTSDPNVFLEAIQKIQHNKQYESDRVKICPSWKKPNFKK